MNDTVIKMYVKILQMYWKGKVLWKNVNLKHKFNGILMQRIYLQQN